MSQHFNAKKIFELTILLTIVTIIIITSFQLAHFVETHEEAKAIIVQLGYLGVFIVSLISGLNVFFPIPPATFVPIFTAADLLIPFIIVALVLGTLTADIIGYIIGLWSKNFLESHYPRLDSFFTSLNVHHHKWLLPFIFLYSGLAPIPNEALLIPLAVMGIKLRFFIIPLILGTTLYHTLTVFGIQNLFAHFL